MSVSTHEESGKYDNMDQTCPESELIAACAEGNLIGVTRGHVILHLVCCSRCYELFVETIHTSNLGLGL